jgi:tetratricopeptide (TPR) repeat protein
MRAPALLIATIFALSCAGFCGDAPRLALNLGADGLDAGYRAMYNLQFEQAQSIFARWEQEHPQDAMGPVSEAAAVLFSEFDRLHILELAFFTDDRAFAHRTELSADPARRQAFLVFLGRAANLCSRALAANPNDRNALLADVMISGLKGDYESLIEHHDLAALTDIKAARAIAEKLIGVDPAQYDAYLAIGIENYLLSQRVAPVRWMLHWGGAETDKTTGLRNLTVTAEKGHYLQPFARLMLAIADLRDRRPERARSVLAQLAQAFPRNPLYAREMALIH